MPPFLPRKRLSSTPPESPRLAPAKRARVADSDDAGSKLPPMPQLSKEFSLGGSDSDSSLSDVDSSDFEDISKKVSQVVDEGDEDSEDDIEWEDANGENEIRPAEHVPVAGGDLQLIFRKDNEIDLTQSASTNRKGPTKREKEVRIRAHCMHVQFLLYHNAIRNRWICDEKLQEILVKQLPLQIMNEVEKWRVASGLSTTATAGKLNAKRAKGRKKKEDDPRRARDWGRPSQRVEVGKPDLSRGDPLIPLMKVLSAYWKKRFAITAPGLRKRGYGTKLALKQEITSLREDKHDAERHGEKIQSIEQFRALAVKSEGSRDVGAQLFTALVRGLGIEARLVASLQPTGFGWTKVEQASPLKARHPTRIEESSSSDESIDAKPKGRRKSMKPAGKGTGGRNAPIGLDSDQSDGSDEDSASVVDVTPSIRKAPPPKYDRDLAYPIYWTEVISPVSCTVLPVSPLVISSPVASLPENFVLFEPRGAKAVKTKQVIAYVIAYSADLTAKDVTTRYLKNRIWPGKTKSFRLPPEKVPIYDKRGKVKRHEQYDWFKTVISPYTRTDKQRTAIDDVEESTDLVPAEPEKKKTDDDGDTLQSLKASAEFVLERHLRREEALREGAESVRMFVTGKEPNQKEEAVYLRSDVLRCLTAESWHKEGRRPLPGSVPLKLVPVRAVTLTRKREAEEHERMTGEKQMQGLYSWEQTEYIIPPRIQDGVIPKNSYGNMDCFVPSMIPAGAIHLPLRGTVRICKKLEVDFAEAVTGFEFGNKRAVPICTGVVVAAENAELVREAWKEWQEKERIKEESKLEKQVLNLWRKFIMGLRIREKVEADYGGEENDELEASAIRGSSARQPIDIDMDDEPNQDAGIVDGGGFLLPYEDDEPEGGELVMEDHEAELVKVKDRLPQQVEAAQYPTPESMTSTRAKKKAQKSLLAGASEGEDKRYQGGERGSQIESTRLIPSSSSANPSRRSVKSKTGASRPARPQLDSRDSTSSLSDLSFLSDDEEGDSNDDDDSDDDEDSYPPRSRPQTSKTNRRTAATAAPGAKGKATATTTPRRRAVATRSSTITTSPYFDRAK